MVKRFLSIVFILTLCAPAYAVFPTVAATNTSVQTTATTSHTVSLPSGIVSGNMLIVKFIYRCGSCATLTWPAGWAQLFASSNSNRGIEYRYRIADGTEGASIALTTSVAEKSAHLSLRITGHHATTPPEIANSGDPAGTDSNPPSLDPSGWGVEDTLWIVGSNVQSGITVSSYPLGYSGGIGADSTGGSVDGVRVAAAYKTATSGSEDPGVFTYSGATTFSRSTTIAIRPAVQGQPPAVVRAFPSAEGLGRDAIGGRGGAPIYVTNCNDSGAGSLRTALNTVGPGIIIFKATCGTITLTTPITMGATHGFKTIACHTAPGGIQFKGPVRIRTSEVIARHCRFRPGDAIQNEDGIILWSQAGVPINNVVLDHASVEWGEDESLDLATASSNAITNVTVQWSIIAEGVGMNAGVPHRFCMLINGLGLSATFHHNLLATCADRLPLASRTALLDWRNNISYNWGGNNAVKFGNFANNWTTKVNFVKNNYIAGPNSGGTSAGYSFIYNGDTTRENGGTKIYFDGNLSSSLCPTGCVGNEWAGWKWIDGDIAGGSTPATESKYRVSTAFSVPAITEHSADQLETVILPVAGAYKPSRDSVDTRIVNDVTKRTGDNANNVANMVWPTLGGGTYPTDTDDDGIPDAWETACSLNVNSAADASLVSSNGYTHIENYLNELAGDTIPGNPCGSAPPVTGTLAVTKGQWFPTYAPVNVASLALASLNADFTVPPFGSRRLREKIDCTAADCNATRILLQYQKNGGSWTSLANTFTAGIAAFGVDDAHIEIPADNTPLTETLPSDHAIDQTGALLRRAVASPEFTLVQNSEIEFAHLIKFDGTVVKGDRFCFRIVKDDGTTVISGSLPCLDVVNPSVAAGRY